VGYVRSFLSVSGPAVNVLPAPYWGSSNVRVEIFTPNFRKVKDETFTNVPSGTAVTANIGRTIGKLLVLKKGEKWKSTGRDSSA
jgi:hypothetical protein